MEGSFAQAANLHHFKRARWRRRWRQQIQDWLIAACQNIKLLVRYARPNPAGAGILGLAFPRATLTAFRSDFRRAFDLLPLIPRIFLHPVCN
jgi:hypothetical protein